MFNPQLVPATMGQIAHTPSPKMITLSQQGNEVVLCVDRGNDRFTSHVLTRKQLNSISLFAMKLIAEGWSCFPLFGSLGWMIVREGE